MVFKGKKRLILTCAAFLAAAMNMSAQNSSGQTDSLVRLLSAKYIEQTDVRGESFRKAMSPTFLHNGTYLICDSALWNVDRKVINCYGNVQLIQGESVLTSENLDYLIDDNLATFRGSLVQLKNKKDNLLRTRKLDYNTKDSLAVFFGGASMKSEDGQIIESDSGTYSNARSFFTFRDNVNMFTDSVFVKTQSLDFDSDKNIAHFNSYIDFWKDENMLSANSGWYDRMKETFFFKDEVHGMSREQETWCDTLYFYRNTNDVLMLSRAHVQDTSRKVAALSDHIFYRDSLSEITMRSRAGVALWAEQQGKVDTTYMSADTLVYKTVRRCDIPSSEVQNAVKRLEDILVDAVSEYRARAAREAAERAEQAKENNANFAAQKNQGLKASSRAMTENSGGATATKLNGRPAEPEPAHVAETPDMPSDSLSTAVADTLAAAPDTSKVGFLRAIGDIRIFKSDMQARCDSLRYNDLDSIARLFKNPVIWNDGNRQYSSDSLFVLVKGNALDRASLMSNAFVLVREDSLYFDQIKSTDIVAFFDSEGGLKRFDALGGVNAMFYLEENESLATVNKVEGTMLSAVMKNGDLERVYYYDHPRNDAYPIVQLPPADHRMKGFNWQMDRAPATKADVTQLDILPSERSVYESHPKASFKQTDIYFPGYMERLYAGLDSVRVSRRSASAERERMEEDRHPAVETADSLVVQAADTLGVRAVRDSVSAVVQTAARDSSDVKKPAGDYMSDRELKRALRIAKRDARWAELDARDAEKAALKKAREEARRQKREDRLAERRKRQEAKDKAKLDKYIERYNKEKERNERKQEPEPSGKRSPGIETGGELQTFVEPEQQTS